MNEQTERPKLSDQLERRGITPEAWHTLTGSIFPGARDSSILLAIDYCKARKLDVLKKPCHIVEMEVATGELDERGFAKTEKRDVILPGIYEYRTTATRTGQYLGHTTPTYGEMIELVGAYGEGDAAKMMVPEWCAMTVMRWNPEAGRVAEFPVVVYFTEVCATKARGSRLNTKWTKSPRQMLTKCTEAAALREGFPEELGGEPTFEEMIDQRHPESAAAVPALPELDDGLAELNQALGVTADAEEVPRGEARPGGTE